MNTPNTTRAILLALFAAPSMTTAQNLTIDWSTIDGGGTAVATAGSLELAGTLGQFDAGLATNGTLSLASGFWDLTDGAPGNTVSQVAAVPGPERVLLSFRGATVGVARYLIERSSGGSSTTVLLATLPVNATGDYAFLDQSAWSGSTYTYLISEQYVVGQRIPRASITAKPYGTTLPIGMTRVGPGDHPTIQAAIAAAPPGRQQWNISVEPGNYDAFQVDATAPQYLRVVADGTGPVIIDTSGASLRITSRTAQQTLELSGLTVGNAASLNDAIVVDGSDGVVILDRLNVAAQGAFAGVRVTQSRSVALQSCQVAAGVGVAMDGARVVAGRTTSSGISLANASYLTVADWTNTGSQQVDGSSTFESLPGTMPNIESPTFAATDFPFAIDIEAAAARPYALFVSVSNGWLELPAVELPLLLNPFVLVEAAIGQTDQNGEAQSSLQYPASQTGLLGNSLVFQLATIDFGTQTVRMSNVMTKIGMPD